MKYLFFLLHRNKVVLVVPQETRRSLGPSSWRSSSPRYRKSSHAGEAHYHKYHSTPVYYRSKKPIHETPSVPHGGDDFDQGYEHVNHVHIPYEKGISHGVSFGKGYIPYDQIKGSFSLGRERWEYWFYLRIKGKGTLHFIFVCFCSFLRPFIYSFIHLST